MRSNYNCFQCPLSTLLFPLPIFQGLTTFVCEEPDREYACLLLVDQMDLCSSQAVLLS